MTVKRILIAVLITLAIANCAFSQENDSLSLDSPKNIIEELQMKDKYGIYGNYNYNMYLASFGKLPGVPSCCPEFTYGSGKGITVGGLFEKPLSNELHLNFRLGYTQYNGYLTSEESTTVIIDGVSQPGIFEHYLEATIPAFIFEPMAAYQYTENLFFHGGLRLGLALSPEYEQFEHITQPSTRGTFEDGSKIRNASKGDMPESMNFQAGINIGVSYLLPMDNRSSLFLSPEIFYTFNFTPVVSGETWLTHQLRAGIAIKYRQPLPPPPPPLPPPAQPKNDFPLPPPPPIIAADVNAVEVDSNGRENPNFNIRIEDFVSLNMRPLLNYIFFEENSSEIPPRYNKLEVHETPDFNLKQLQDLNAIETYYYVLDIVGKRMRDNPDEKIKLIGTNSDNGPEKGNVDLSLQRALSVRDYLQSVWGVHPDRIDVEARNKPKQPTRDDEPGGDAENRRVEIISDGVITDPVITIDTMRVLSTTKVKFIPEIDSDMKLANWRITAKQNDRILSDFQGKGNIPESILWDMTAKDAKVPTTAGNIFYWLEVEDVLGQKAESSKHRLPVEQLTIDRKRLESMEDKEYEYYSLILFDFGTTNLGKEHREVVDFVKGRIKDRSKVTIRGYTDSMGDEAINERISKQRADAVAKRLRIPGASVEGSGEAPLLFDNSLPEGRFYCRTVQIEIETKVNGS